MKNSIPKMSNDTSTKRPRSAIGRTVLDEGTYTEALTQVITKTYFPDLALLRSTLSDTPPPTPSHTHDSNSLKDFHSRYVSEDCKAYSKIVRVEEERCREGRLAIQEREKEERTRDGVRGWEYTARNSLMYGPGDGGGKKGVRRLLSMEEGRRRGVCSGNTRFCEEGDVEGEDGQGLIGSRFSMPERESSGKTVFRIQEESLKKRLGRNMGSRVIAKKRLLQKSQRKDYSVRVGATPVRISKAACKLAQKYGMTPAGLSTAATPKFLTPRLTPQLGSLGLSSLRATPKK